MKLKIGFLVVIISLAAAFTSYSQTTCLPDSVLKKVVDELIVKDHLQYTVSVQDSILGVYKLTIKDHQEKINTYILKEQEYKSIIGSLEQRIDIKAAQITDAKKEAKKGKLKAFLTGTVVGGVITVILVLL